jgi:hypothetical protein
MRSCFNREGSRYQQNNAGNAWKTSSDALENRRWRIKIRDGVNLAESSVRRAGREAEVTIVASHHGSGNGLTTRLGLRIGSCCDRQERRASPGFDQTFVASFESAEGCLRWLDPSSKEVSPACLTGGKCGCVTVRHPPKLEGIYECWGLSLSNSSAINWK